MKVGGERMFLWLAIDDEGEVPDMLVQERRNKGAALRLLRKLLRTQGGATRGDHDRQTAFVPCCGPGCGSDRSPPAWWNATEQSGGNSHLPIRRRERKQQKFKSRASAQEFLATHAAVYNVFNLQPHLIRRPPLRHLRADPHQTRAAATVAV